MQINKIKIFALIILFVLFFSSICYATEETAIEGTEVTDGAETEEILDEEDGENTEISEDDTSNMLEKDYFYFIDNNTSLTLSEIIDSNAFIIANDVTITGEIGGDLFVMANSVKLDGAYIYGNVFVISKELTVNATVYDIYALCSKINIEYDGVIYRDLRAAAGEITIKGGVGRNCYLNSDNLKIEQDAIIYGNVEYTSSEAIVVPEGAVQGEIKYNEKLTDDSSTVSYAKTFGDHIISLIATLLTTVVVYLIVSHFAPNFYAKLREIKISKIFIAFGIGIASVILVPVLCIVLFITNIGITLALVILLLYVVMLLISYAISCITIGLLVANKFAPDATKLKNIGVICLTAIALFVISLIPVVGRILSGFLVLTGFGLLIINAIKKNKE